MNNDQINFFNIILTAFPWEVIGLIFFAIALPFIFIFGIRYYLRHSNKLPAAFHKVILLVRVPKEVHEGQEKKDLTKEIIQGDISPAEDLFAAIGGLKSPKGWRTFLWGREDHVSFEIVSHLGQISFYVAVPQYLKQYLEQQIHGQYPHAQISEVEDYNIFSSQCYISGACLVFSRAIIYPIKTYRQHDSDPLDAVNNSLSKLKGVNSAAIQYVVRTAPPKWHQWSKKVVQSVYKGTPLAKAAATGLLGSRFSSGSVITKGVGEFFRVGYSGKTEAERKMQNLKNTPPQPYRPSAREEEALKGIEEKSSKAGLEVNIRIIVSSDTKVNSQVILNNIINSFSQYGIYEYGNKFSYQIIGKPDKLIHDFIYRNFSEKKKMLLNTEELASVYHFPLPSTETPNINWLGARSAPPPANMPTEGVILGTSLYRGEEVTVRLKTEDRRRHMYIIGMTGTGKSVLMEEMAKQDIRDGKGVCIVDPHGTFVESVLPCIPKERINDVIYFNPSDIERPMGLNMLEASSQEEIDFATQEMIQIFYKLVTDPQMIGPMFEHYMRNAMFLLMNDPNDPASLVELPRVFTDDQYRKYRLKKEKNILVKDFWEREYAQSQRGSSSADMLSYVISKVGRFIENEMMRNIVGQASSGFNFQEVMNQGKILLINLSKGQVGELNSNLLGLIIVSKLQMAALARASLPESERKDFYLYIDEFQNYVTDSISTILAEARKYRLDLIMAHQYVSQLVKGQDTSVRDAVFGNAGTIAAFRIGVEDAETMAKQFAPVFGEYDLINIPKYNAYIRLLIDNSAARAFNMQTQAPTKGDPILSAKIKELSRLKYGRDRKLVDAEIMERSRLGQMAKPDTSDLL